MRDVARGILFDGDCTFSDNPINAVRGSAFTIQYHKPQSSASIPVFRMMNILPDQNISYGLLTF